MKYRKKPIVVEAFRLTKENWNAPELWPEWMQQALHNDDFDKGRRAWFSLDDSMLFIGTLEGTYEASVGDWIIRSVEGEIYPCKHSIFVKTYEPVDEQNTKENG